LIIVDSAIMVMKTLPIISLALVGMVVGFSPAAAVNVEVKYKNEYHPVIDVRRNTPVIEVDGKRRSINTAEIRVNREDGSAIKEGYVNLRHREIWSQNMSPRNNVRSPKTLAFRAEIKSSVDIENNFIVLSLVPNAKQPKLLLAELPDFKADTWTKVSFNVPLNKVIPTAGAKQFIFSNGSYVMTQQQFNQSQRRRKR